eukprot:CAMPEP_0175068512 /NCGR_PEP_ID=MMETSP0052_2-20121109/17713_1 /TAXON_ID=51329 ORGANISM="Polytomella parva, Strain SAG 63-3" /NCGR_SAMPLE_ID=MMETSP0052_2 /ASSEMBLY_ACC=CAM_ASM_000194 /LENGTH=469 /DNA_ID=CAMNT_0016335549 /DNA_START=44 /DNA_END=1453 /DNA_ORIENTATION=+
MANTTDPFAKSVHGTNPQNLIEYIVRSKILQTIYWKEECFALTAESLLEKAVEINAVGGTCGGQKKPTNFLCLILKLLQIQPDKDIIIEYIRNDDFKYVRMLGAFYLRLVGRPIEVYQYLEPLYNDFSKIRLQDSEGRYVLTTVDEVVDDMLRKDFLFDIALPRLPMRKALEKADQLPPRESALDEEFDEAILDLEAQEAAQEAAALQAQLGHVKAEQEVREKEKELREREKERGEREREREREGERSRDRSRERDRDKSRDRSREREKSRSRDKLRERKSYRDRSRERIRERDRRSDSESDGDRRRSYRERSRDRGKRRRRYSDDSDSDYSDSDHSDSDYEYRRRQRSRRGSRSRTPERRSHRNDDDRRDDYDRRDRGRCRDDDSYRNARRREKELESESRGRRGSPKEEEKTRAERSKPTHHSGSEESKAAGSKMAGEKKSRTVDPTDPEIIEANKLRASLGLKPLK